MKETQESITIKNIERAMKHAELVKYRETETKLFVTQPEAFSQLRNEAVTIEQVYLSSPDDEFSLRVRKEYLPDGPRYSAQLKDRGIIADDALVRTEIPATDLSEEAFEYYARNPRFTPLVQHRAYITPEMSIDFIDKFDTPIIEIETDDPVRRSELVAQLDGLATTATTSRLADKEYLAHDIHGSPSRKSEKSKSVESLDAFSDRVAREMVAHYVSGKNRVVAGLTGMSGSGKTTVTRLIQDKIVEHFGETFRPLILSTDDYHFGKTKLEATYGAPWTAWDDPRTYNTAELARDLELMNLGQGIIRRHFDFETEEPAFDEEVPSMPFVIIEGLYAGSKDLEDVRDVHFELPSSIATSIGRDVRRLVIENRANRVFPTPESRLRYQLEVALPLYLEQDRPKRNSFSASVRPMAERAFMLSAL